MNVLQSFAYDWRVSLGITLLGLAFFGALTIHSFLRPNKRAYLPGLLLIDLGILNSLVRNLFFFHLSAHPLRPGGVWRLATALIIVSGFVLFERAWRQERARKRN